jgi:hypothetical protein
VRCGASAPVHVAQSKLPPLLATMKMAIIFTVAWLAGGLLPDALAVLRAWWDRRHGRGLNIRRMTR